MKETFLKMKVTDRLFALSVLDLSILLITIAPIAVEQQVNSLIIYHL